MLGPRAKADEGVLTGVPPVGRVSWLLVGAIVASGVLLRAARLAEPPSGYLVFNEGFYIDLAMRMTAHPAFAWFYSPLDVNNPPLFPVLVSGLYRFGAPLVAGARAVSVLAGAWSVFATYLLGRLLYDEWTGIVAAALLAVMPGAVLVDHNIQVDPLFVALVLTSLLLYVTAARTGSVASMLSGGAVLGLAVLTKQAAIVVIPALVLWETWCAHGLPWLKTKRFWRFLTGFLVVGLPWYLTQILMKNASPMFANAASIAENSGSLDLTFWIETLGRELVWMAFPVTAIVALGGFALQAVRRTPGDKFVLVMTGIMVVWYAVFHRHSYYLLPLAPFLALGASCALNGLKRFGRLVVGASAALLLVCMLLGAVLMMGGQKWGRWSPMDFDRNPDAGYSSVKIFYEAGLGDFFGPTIGMMRPRVGATPVTTPDFLSAPEEPGVESLLLSGTYSDDAGKVLPAREPIVDTWIRPVLFGYAIGQTTPAHLGADLNATRLTDSQFFRNAPWSAERVGPLWRFGVQESATDSGIYVYDKGSFQTQNLE